MTAAAEEPGGASRVSLSSWFIRHPIGTSLLIIVANSAAGVVSHLGGAGIDWPITTAFVGTAIVGSLVAGHYGTKLDTGRLQRWFAYLVFVVAGYVLVDTIFLH